MGGGMGEGMGEGMGRGSRESATEAGAARFWVEARESQATEGWAPRECELCGLCGLRGLRGVCGVSGLSGVRELSGVRMLTTVISRRFQ